MIPHLIRLVCVGALATLLMSGCANTNKPTDSGFLKDYSRLKTEDVPGGGTRRAYVSPDFTPSRYNAILLQPVVYYPDPQPTEEVPMETLASIRSYVETSVRQKFGQQVMLTDKPGAGVANVRIAITAVGAETQALKAYQYIPIGLAITGVVAVAEGGRPKDATIAMETSVTDSMTDELLYAAVRGGTGKRIEAASQGAGGVEPADLQPLIDTWADGAAQEIGKYVAQK
ncbi:DUF3313 domain-containing protein [Bordetella flabilis]|uniref:DUF3313 domain-containing protein n=1 Tax=Bordetella flabilis TaxID=463014 RepID=A0A193GKQ3_9BORD|nr:DUF3313 domain-containing protein [Bordetella flabilis]ANN80158.1 hypothetical protein BAU07_01890 [Bordetella flabilis]